MNGDKVVTIILSMFAGVGLFFVSIAAGLIRVSFGG